MAALAWAAIFLVFSFSFSNGVREGLGGALAFLAGAVLAFLAAGALSPPLAFCFLVLILVELSQGGLCAVFVATAGVDTVDVANVVVVAAREGPATAGEGPGNTEEGPGIAGAGTAGKVLAELAKMAAGAVVVVVTVPVTASA